MSQRARKRLRQILFNESGQMSIFVALIFQVLFVFFAMVVNVGLLVHDKINLQNAVDLGAYYGAQRQAELLNELAHINYQMRQDYKLLTWRYRVLGTLGREEIRDRVPAFSPIGSPLDDSPVKHWTGSQEIEEIPPFCVAHIFWREFSLDTNQQENLCWKDAGFGYPQIPPVTIVAPWIGALFAAQAATQQAIQSQQHAFQNAGPLNWIMLMQMVFAYKQTVSIRKREIWSLREMLVSDGDNFKDLGLNSIKEGVKKTVTYNLTAANRETLEFEFINGLSQGQCADGTRPGDFAFPEVRTAPLFLYSRIQNNTFQAVLHKDLPANVNLVDPLGFYPPYLNEPNNPDTNPMHSSLGFEKNPWCMAYVGVKAKTRPHKPFAPFGSPIQLTARAFAQPFGGRIGPWYMSGWSRSAPFSSVGRRVDPNTSARLVPGMTAINYQEFMPNFSRYPGDPYGLKSKRAQGITRHMLRDLLALPPPQKVSITDYYSFDRIHKSGDPLAWSMDPASDNQPPNPVIKKLRDVELTAIAPDLFDATYYSIEPRYYQAYNEQGVGAGLQRFVNLGPPDLPDHQLFPAPDLGARRDNPALAKGDVRAQVVLANGGGIEPSLQQSVYWMIRKPEHLLTGWSPQRVGTYGFPTERYGKCDKAASESVMIPGGCAVGGRTGYSVRLISRDHLLFDKWSIGGEGGGQGAILNPPPSDF